MKNNDSGNFPKSLMTAFFVLFAIFSLHAEKFTYSGEGEHGFNLDRSTPQGINLTFSVNEWYLEDQDIEGEIMKNVMLPGSFLPNHEGAPNLPGMSRMIAIPQGATAYLKILSVKTEIIEGVDVAPAFQIPKDTEDGPLKYQKDTKIYSKNGFYPQEPIQLSAPSKIRGLDVVMLGITPFQYNPVTKELKVLRDIQVEVTFSGGNSQFGDNRLRSRWWDPILKDAVINSEVIPAIDYTKKFAQIDQTKNTDYEYVIIVPDDPTFIAWADSIRQWRTLQGIRTGIFTTTDVGGNNTSAIENWVNNAYNNWTVPPAAVLLMADYGTSGNTIISPVWNSYCVSDNIYADVDNNDLPDIVFARMTAQNATHLQTMVTKFLDHERTPPTNPGYYNNPITACGWQTERWFQICSEVVGGYWNHVQGKSPVRINAIYSGTPGSSWSSNQNTYMVTDYFGPNGLGYIPASPSTLGGWTGGNATMVNNSINSGAFMLQHRDHGGTTGWGEPDYQSSDINGLNNTDLTFVFSINCLTGKYNISGECFTEKFHRYTYNGQNSGALGLTAASEISYSFVNDTYVWGLFDNLWPDFMPDYGTTPPSRDVLPAFGNAAGKIFLEQSNWPYNPQHKVYTHHLFHHHGDAFMTVYSEIPQNLTVQHDPVILSGVNSFTVTANQDALIALTVNGQIIGTATGTGSPVTITIPPQDPGNTMLVTVTKQNYYRYTSSVDIIPPSGPFVSYNSHAIDDSYGNNNGQVDFDEDILLDMTLENLGSATAYNVNATLMSSDPYVSITDNYEDYGTINAGATATQTGAFAFTVADDIPDQHIIDFELQIVGSSDDTWTSYFSITANAPMLSLSNIFIDDAAGGNGNNRMDPGETVNLIFENDNTGNSPSPGATATLSSSSPYLTVNTGVDNIGVIGSGGTVDASFSVTVDPAAPIGTSVDLVYDLTAGNYGFGDTYYETIGLVLEDWETGDFSQFFWQFGGSANWLIDTSDPYEGTYCSQSGDISDNQTSELNVTLNVSQAGTISFWKKVSSESNYDYLRFYIDGNEQGAWAGSVGWSQETYNVSAGAHTFKWVYDKDYSVSSGSDCAWVDYIIFPPVAPPAPSISVNPLNIDFGNVFVGDSYDQQFTITNDGSDVLNGTISTPTAYSVAAATKDNDQTNKKGSNFSENTINYTVNPGVTETFDLTFSPTAVQTYTGDVVITHNATGGDVLISVTGAGINGLPLPYTQDFEEGGSMPYGWINETGNDFDWSVNSGGTPSYNTGPTGDHTTGSGYYIYTESSSPNYPSKTASIQTPVFDIGNSNDVEMRVWYHMYGAAMGSLHIDAYSGGSWQNDIISPISGDQGNQWHELTVDLSAYTGTLKLRFRGITGSSYTSDMAIDDFVMEHVVVNPVINVNPSSLAFGDVPVGDNQTLQFTIENTGNGSLVGDIASPVGYNVAQAKSYTVFSGWKDLELTDNIITYNVLEGNTGTFDLTFEPILPQAYNGDVEITSNDPANPLVLIPVTGTGIAPPDISVNPTSFTVTLPPDDMATEILNILNSGAADLTFDITIEDPSSGLIPQQVSPALEKAIENRELGISGNELEQTTGKEQPVLPGANLYGEGDNKAEEVFGSWSNTWSGSDRDRGNIFHVTTTTTLEESRFYLNITASTELYFFVYEGTSATGSFNLIDQVHIPSSGTGEGWYSSGAINVPLTAGNYYYIGTSWSGTATYGRGNESVPLPTSFGELITGVPATTAGFPPASTANNTYTGMSPYYQTIVTGSGSTPSWLSVNPINGTVTGGQSFSVDVEFNSNGMSNGTYNKNLLVSSNDPDQPLVTIPVTMIVADVNPPVIGINPTSLSAHVLVDGQFDDYFTVSNSGEADLTYNSSIEYLTKSAGNPINLGTVVASNDISNKNEISPFKAVGYDPPKAVGDILLDIDAQTATGDDQLLGAEFDGTYLWATGAGGTAGTNPNQIYQLDVSGNLLNTYAQGTSSSWGIRDLVYDGAHLYGGDEDGFYQIDPATGTVTTLFTGSLGLGCIRAVAISPAGNSFLACNWSTDIYEFDSGGNILNIYTNPGLSTIYGLAYDEETGNLWIFDRTGTPETTFYEYDLSTQSLTGNSLQVPLLTGATNQMNGGAFFSTDLISGKIVLGGMTQGDPNDRLFAVELGDLIADSWLSITSNSAGTVSGPTGSIDVNVHYDATGLDIGLYTANIKIQSNDPVNSLVTIPVTFEVGNLDMPFDLSAFIEGPYNGTDMNTDLNSDDFLPLGQPYNTAPWNYTGSESVSAMPNANVVDWLLVQIRETDAGAGSATSATIVDEKALLLLKDGSIRGLDGSGLPLMNVSTTNVYPVIFHRNHIPVISENPASLIGGVFTHDFSTGENQAHGGSTAHKDLGNGVFGMAGGDGNADGQIDNADKNIAWYPFAGQSGYLMGDFDLDCNVTNADKNEIFYPNSGSGSQVPDNVPEGGFISQVPK